jgi:anti-sigma factor RsiW
MNRSNFRLLPTPAADAADTGATVAAESELVALFGDLIARGERDERYEMAPDYELLEAAVDGKLDAVETELFESRLAGDPALAREFNELMALRDSLQHRATPARKSSRPAPHRWVRFAAAAVLLAAAGLGLRLDLRYRSSESTSASLASARPMTSPAAASAPSGRQVVFADSFEHGTTDHWSN